MTKGTPNANMRPIFDVMYDQHLIEHKMFSLCLGKDGGYFQLGGFDATSHLTKNVSWIPLVKENHAYTIQLKGIRMNGHMMGSTHIFTAGIIDSGTTFTYVPQKLFTILMDHFDWFCLLDPNNHCKGKRIHTGADSNTICFQYDEQKHPDGPKDYFLSYPVLNF